MRASVHAAAAPAAPAVVDAAAHGCSPMTTEIRVRRQFITLQSRTVSIYIYTTTGNLSQHMTSATEQLRGDCSSRGRGSSIRIQIGCNNNNAYSKQLQQR